MGYTDPKNPLNYILPAGVLAYIASPEVRKAVRTGVVKSVAAVLEVAEKAENATTGLRDEFNTIVNDAKKMREEEKQPSIKVDVQDADTGPGAGPGHSAGPEGAPA